MRRHPERFRAYVGVGQVVGGLDITRPLQEGWLREEARRRGDDEALEMLDTQGPAAYETLLFRYGAEIRDETSFVPLILTGLMSPEYTTRDALRVGPGSSFSSRHMTYDAEATGSLLEMVEQAAPDTADAGASEEDAAPPAPEFYPVPAFFFTGRRDWVTPYPLIEEFAERVGGTVVWFDESATSPSGKNRNGSPKS